MTASVRIDDESFERLKQLAEEEDRPMTRIVRAAIDAYDQVKLAKVAKRPSGGTIERTKKGPISPKVQVEGPVLADIAETPKKGCPHPKEERQVHTWGTRCGVCGAILK